MSELAKSLKLYGERNTGSRYLETLVRQNLSVNFVQGVVPPWIEQAQRRLRGTDEFVRDIYFFATQHKNLGWKHRLPSPKQLQAAKHLHVVVTLTKNPYSWLLSMHRRPHHNMHLQAMSFEHFLDSDITMMRREGMPVATVKPVELWNMKNTAYLNLGEVTTVNARSEEVVLDPLGVLNRLRDALREPPLTTFSDTTESTKGDSKTNADYRRYYGEELWRDSLSPAAIDLIAHQVDRTVVDAFGYEVLAN